MLQPSSNVIFDAFQLRQSDVAHSKCRSFASWSLGELLDDVSVEIRRPQVLPNTPWIYGGRSFSRCPRPLRTAEATAQLFIRSHILEYNKHNSGPGMAAHAVSHLAYLQVCKTLSMYALTQFCKCLCTFVRACFLSACARVRTTLSVRVSVFVSPGGGIPVPSSSKLIDYAVAPFSVGNLI